MGRTFLVLIAACCPSWAADPAPAKAPEPGIEVTCHGKLRHPVGAIGGETTGTNVTFNEISWELKLPDEATKKFAENHNKKEVTVTGRLRRVAGVEIPVRWIVDVEQLTPQKPNGPKNAATITFTGKLRATKAGTVPTVIDIGADAWPVDWAEAPELQKKATGMAGNLVQAKGMVERNPDFAAKIPAVFRLNQVQQVQTAAPAVPMYR